MFSGLLQKKSVKRKAKFDGNFLETKFLSRLSHKVCRLLSSPVLLRKLTIVYTMNPTVVTQHL